MSHTAQLFGGSTVPDKILHWKEPMSLIAQMFRGSTVTTDSSLEEPVSLTAQSCLRGSTLPEEVITEGAREPHSSGV